MSIARNDSIQIWLGLGMTEYPQSPRYTAVHGRRRTPMRSFTTADATAGSIWDNVSKESQVYSDPRQAKWTATQKLNVT